MYPRTFSDTILGFVKLSLIYLVDNRACLFYDITHFLTENQHGAVVFAPSMMLFEGNLNVLLGVTIIEQGYVVKWYQFFKIWSFHFWM